MRPVALWLLYIGVSAATMGAAAVALDHSSVSSPEWYLGMMGAFVAANSAFCSITGYTISRSKSLEDAVSAGLPKQGKISLKSKLKELVVNFLVKSKCLREKSFEEVISAGLESEDDLRIRIKLNTLTNIGILWLLFYMTSAAALGISGVILLYARYDVIGLDKHLVLPPSSPSNEINSQAPFSPRSSHAIAYSSYIDNNHNTPLTDKPVRIDDNENRKKYHRHRRKEISRRESGNASSFELKSGQKRDGSDQH